MKIISDTHFSHKNLLNYEPIRIQKIQTEGYNNFDNFLVDYLNLYINKNDNILHLGDVAFKNGYKYAKKLNGKFTLIKGNHDKKLHIDFYKSIGWRVIEDIQIEVKHNNIHNYLKIFNPNILAKTACLIQDIGSKRILFSHYPIFNNNPYDETYRPITEILEFLFFSLNCEINIHGHTHSFKINDNRCINACLEVNDFKPIKI